MSKSLYTTIIEETAPTTTTVGVVGQLYLDSTTKILYQCVAINIEDLTYEWKQIGGGVTEEDLNTLQTTVNELTPKVMRALVTPINAPSVTELVAVDDGNSQTMIEIGEGLLLENGVLKAMPDKILLFANDNSNVHSATIDASTIAYDDIIEVQFMGSEVIKTRFKYSMLTTNFKISSSFVSSSGQLITNTQYFTISRNSDEGTITFTYTHYNHFVNENGTVTSTTDNAPSSAQWIRRIYKVVD